jgi:hypothetical protein
MTVRCAGDTHLLEQLGEKQDFECLLTTRGLPHEDFALRVRRLPNRKLGEAWSCDYSVTVTCADRDVQRTYAGGPAYRWIERFAADLARGTYDRRSVSSAVCPRRRSGGTSARNEGCAK